MYSLWFQEDLVSGFEAQAGRCDGECWQAEARCASSMAEAASMVAIRNCKSQPSEPVADGDVIVLSAIQPEQQAHKETHRQSREGSIIDFRDEFEMLTMKKYPFHRFTLYKTRKSALQLYQNAPPGSMLSYCD